MHAMTAANLRSSFGGESMAHMRYLRWGQQAKEEGFANVARLFEAVSFSEQIHAHNHFNAMADQAGAFLVAAGGGFGLGTTSQNLQGAIDGENFEVDEMYPAYIAAASVQKESNAERSMRFALAAEKTHAALYGKAKQSVDAGKDAALGPIQICDNCGYTAEGPAPATCPLCGLGKQRFKTFA